jgi:hypothetical protein
MVKILATKVPPPGRKMAGSLEAVRAEALFVSTLQSAGSPSPIRSVAPSRRRCDSWECGAVPHRWPPSSATIRTPPWRG